MLILIFKILLVDFQGLSFKSNKSAPWDDSGIKYFYFENWRYMFYFDMNSLKPVYINFNDSKYGDSYDDICFVASNGYEERKFSKDEFKIEEYCNQKQGS